MMPERLTLSVEEAGQKLGISRNTAYSYAKKGIIPTIRLGKRLLVPIGSFQALLQRLQTPEGAQELYYE